ncbi:MAG: aldehyde dehydrogenase family protein [Ignavibacteria bacterium]|nr:aldehyde dehydrogenase family protein [Ignavibacteria bacterium]
MKIESYNPNSKQKIGEFEKTDPSRVEEIVQKARQAHLKWNSLTIDKRIDFLKKAKSILYRNREKIAKLITEENGKPIFESYSTEIIPTLSLFDYYIKNSKKFLRPHYERIKLPVMIHKKSWIEYVPFGVVGIISPWNYPLLLPMGQIIPALIAGNSVVFKPSEWTPLVGQKIKEIFDEAGLPENVFNIIFGEAEIGKALVESSIDKLFFTGSTKVGKIISKAASEKLLPVSLELGGKDPAIVLADADLDRAVYGILWGSLMNAGQTCVSIERVYVDEKIYDNFLSRLIDEIKKLTPYSNSEFYDYSNIKLTKQVEIIKEHIEDALSKGAKILYGGKIENNFVQPTILIEVNHSMKVMREETFGPVIPIMKFKTIDEAIELANDSDYGLSASIWTKNISLGKSIAKKIQAGSVLINDCISHFGAGEAVIGGIKMSGTGRVHSKSGLMEMVYEKYYNYDKLTWQKKMWWFKYDKHSTEKIKAATEFLFGDNLLRRMLSGLKVLPALFKKH